MTEAAKQKTAEDYVRSRWEQVHSRQGDEEFGWAQVWAIYNIACPIVLAECEGESIEPAWSAAYAFTLEREEQIFEVGQQIALLNGVIMMASQADKTVHLRTLRMLNDALAELKRGMK